MAIANMNMDYAPAKIVIGSFEFSSEEYGIDSIDIKNGCYDGSVVGIGAVYSQIVTIEMSFIDGITKGTQFKLYFKINGSWQLYGIFWVDDLPTKNGKNMTLIAHGIIGEYGETELIFSGKNQTYTLNDVKEQIESITGYSIIFWPLLDSADSSVFLGQKVCFLKDIEDFVQGRDIQTGISVRTALAGLAILFGGNVFEDGNYIRIKAKSYTPNQYTFTQDSYAADYQYSQFQYAIRSIKLSFLPWALGFFSPPGVSGQICTVDYLGDERVQNLLLDSYVTGYTLYDYTIECDWIGWTSDGGVFDRYTPPGGKASGCYNQGDLIYRTGSFSFPGYNQTAIYPGNIISIEIEEEDEPIDLYCGEIELSWDGGFTTKVSCECNIDSGQTSYSASGSTQAEAVAAQSAGMVNLQKISFADITMSNVADSTISGSKFIDGSIEGSKIADSTLTGSKFEDGTIEGSKINFSTFEDGIISGTAIDTSTFKDGSISGSSFMDGTIENSKIKDSTLTGAKIADATIGIEKVNESFISDLTAQNAFISNLTSTVAKIDSLTSTDAVIKNIFSQEIVGDKAILDVLQANIINAEYIKSAVADVGYITADEADISYANITLGNIDTANVDKANIGLLFNEVGLIDRATIVDGHITGFLDAVEINANSITAGTLIADRLLLKGSTDGLLYAINNLGEFTSANVDTLDGTILTQRTVTADKLVANSITTNELDVEDIFADSAIIKKISTGVADIIELDADRIKSGIIDSARINTAEILASHAQFGKDYVTVDVNNESTMFTPDNIHIYNEIGGTKIQEGYIVNTNSSRKNIVPFCNYTANDLIPGDVISVTVTYKYDIQNAQDGVKAFAQFFDSNGYANSRIESSTLIQAGGAGTETTHTFSITIPDYVVKFEFKNGDVDYAYVVFGIMNEYTGTTMYVKSASAIKVSDSIRVIGTSKMDDLVVDNLTVNNLTIEKDLSLDHLRLKSWLEVDGNSTFNSTVHVGSSLSSYGTYIYPDGGLFVFPSSYTTEQTKINSSGIETGGYVKAKGKIISSSIGSDEESAYGYIKMLIDTDGGKIEIKESGDTYQIDAYQGELRIVNQTVGTVALSINRIGIYPNGKILGGKWCYDDTTNYGLYWSSASVLRPISSSYKVSLGSSSYPMSSIYATYLYDNGVRVVGCTYSSSGNFRCYKYRDGRLVIEYRQVLSSAAKIDQTDGNAYLNFIFGGTATFPVAFTAVPMVVCDIARPDLSCPFCSLSVEGVTATGFTRIIAWSPQNITTNVLPAGTVCGAVFIGRWN